MIFSILHVGIFEAWLCLHLIYPTPVLETLLHLSFRKVESPPGKMPSDMINGCLNVMAGKVAGKVAGKAGKAWPPYDETHFFFSP